MTLMVFITLFIFSTSLLAQDAKVKPVLFDGVINIGYINNGGYLNFSGPSLSLAHKNSKWIMAQAHLETLLYFLISDLVLHTVINFSHYNFPFIPI